MKRFLPLLALCALVLPALQSVRADDASVDLFYNNLNGGNWYEVSDYGYVWQPDVASDPNWRPYTDGYWAYTDQGWTWVSYEDFGWATYHYGRWARLSDYGWVWVPGTEWAPAWVSWRTGGDYVGWAPLPPAGGEVVYESRPITGHVDVEFGIGPAFYNFVDVRYIGEPVLRDRIFAPDRNVTIINNTVNVTNITYNNSTVYNYGPDYATVSRYSVRPIQRLKIQRENVDPLQAVRSGSVTKVQGNQLMVAAPMKLQKAAAQDAPKQVKAKIEQPKVEKGWANINPAEKAKIEQQFKTQNPKNIPKPNIQPTNANAAAAIAAPETNAGAPQANRPGKGKGKAAQNEAAAANSPQAGEAAAQPGSERNRAAREGRDRVAPAQTSPAAENVNPNAERRENGGPRKGNKREQNAAPVAPSAAPNPAADNGRNEADRARRENANPAANRAQQRENAQAPNAAAQNERNEASRARRENPNAAANRPEQRENAQRAKPAAENERSEANRSRENANPAPNRPEQHENAQQNRRNEQPGAGEQQERRRGEPQNNARPNAPAAAAPAVQQAERGPAEGRREGQPQQGEHKNKKDKNEGEKTPPPQQ